MWRLEKGFAYNKQNWCQFKIINRTERKQDGGEGPKLISSQENTKITTNCWTMDKKDWNLPKKIFYIQRQRRSHSETVGGAFLLCNRIPHPPGGQPTNWKIIISQRFSHRSETSEPHVRLSSLGGSHQKEEPPEHLALKAGRAWAQELHRTGGNRESALGGYTQGFTCTGTQGKAVTSYQPGPDLPVGLGGSPGEVGVSCVSCRLQCWDTSVQATNRVGTQPHPWADRLPKDILSTQTSLNTPLDMALPIRGTRPSSTHQWPGTSPFHQEACTSPWTNLTHQGADTTTKKNYSPAAWETETTNTES